MDSFFKAAVCDLDKLLDDFELNTGKIYVTSQVNLFVVFTVNENINKLSVKCPKNREKCLLWFPRDCRYLDLCCICNNYAVLTNFLA